jgi:hypothetical protein
MRKRNRRLAIVILLFTASISMFGQGGNINRQVIAPTVANNGTGQPASFANVRVCPSTATGFPCSPLSPNVFSDQALTQALPAAFAADVNGNYNTFLPTGTYLVQESNAIGAGYTFQYSWFVFVNGTGTVSSVAINMPASVFNVAGSPCTTACVFNIGFLAQNARTVFANCGGSSAVPAFCLLNANMIPSTLNSETISGTLTTTGPGDTTIGGVLNVTGATTLGGTLSVNSPVTLTSTLGVSGATTLFTLGVSGNETVGGTLGVTGNTALSGGSLSGTYSGNPTFSGTPVFGTANFTTGIQLAGSFGLNGQCLQSTGTGTIYSSSCGKGGTPTFLAGSGAGTSPTITFLANSTDKMGTVQVTTGSAPPTSGLVVSIYFSTPFPTAAFCVFSQEGTGGAVIPFIITTGVSAASFSLYNQGPPALTAATSYLWNYLCNGY